MDDTWMLWLPMGIGWSPQAVLQTERELPGPRGQHLKQTRHRKGTGRGPEGKLAENFICGPGEAPHCFRWTWEAPHCLFCCEDDAPQLGARYLSKLLSLSELILCRLEARSFIKC